LDQANRKETLWPRNHQQIQFIKWWSWSAAKNAVETAAGSLRDLRVAEIVKQDMTVENGKVAAYRARVLVSFKYGS
jgi:flavin-binding protein dodecin